MGPRATDVRALAGTLERLVVWLRRQVPAEASTSTFSTLDRLRTEGPLRVSEIAAAEAMTQPGVTILVNRLAENGWAERVPDPTDGRASLVRLTEAGEAVLAQRHEARAEALRARLAELDDDDRRRILDALPALDRLTSVSTPRPARKKD